MKFCEVGVFHHDCWFTSAIAKFPELGAKELSSRSYKKDSGKRIVQASYKLSCEPGQEKAFIKHVSENKGVSQAKLVYLGSDPVALVSWKAPFTSYDAVLASGCSYSSQCYSKKGFEAYSLFAEEPSVITALLNELDQIGEVKIFSVKNASSEKSDRFNLTPKQREALVSAISSGYYSWPKKVNLDELAGKLGKKRRALQENLRKAEGKVLPKILEELSKA